MSPTCPNVPDIYHKGSWLWGKSPPWTGRNQNAQTLSVSTTRMQHNCLNDHPAPMSLLFAHFARQVVPLFGLTVFALTTENAIALTQPYTFRPKIKLSQSEEDGMKQVWSTCFNQQGSYHKKQRAHGHKPPLSISEAHRSRSPVA